MDNGLLRLIEGEWWEIEDTLEAPDDDINWEGHLILSLDGTPEGTISYEWRRRINGRKGRVE